MNKRRPDYLKKISPYIGKDIIKVLVGQRRVGKSYLLWQIMDDTKRLNKKANIIHINKELEEFSAIDNSDELISYARARYSSKKKNYLFIDEIQDIINFEKALRHFTAKKQFDIYCSGSNAFLLSSELATLLSGRYIEIPIYSLSFNEFLEFHNLRKSEESLFKFIRYGGLPYLINLELRDDVVYDYLKNIYNSILLRDIVVRYNLRNVNLLHRLVIYLADNVGSFVSAKRISDFLKSQHIRMSPNIILNYLSYLTSAFFTQEVKRIDLIGKKIFEVNEKFYFEDLGLRHSLIGYRQVDLGKILENLIYNHLKFLGYKIMVGRIKGKEIDFVCEKQNHKIYVQVAYLIADDKIKAREFGNLLTIEDNYPKIVVSMDKMISGNFQGVQHMNVLDFLTCNKLPS